MNTSARHDLPDDPLELKKLAFLLGYESATKLLEDCVYFRQENRECFNRLFDQASLINCE
jgi:glutamine synthetase adenylyltransferase